MATMTTIDIQRARESLINDAIDRLNRANENYALFTDPYGDLLQEVTYRKRMLEDAHLSV